MLHILPRSVLFDRGSATRRRLNQVDEVAAGVFKQDGGDWPHAPWLTAEADATLLETAVLRGDVIRYESSGWNTGGKQCCLIRLTRRKTHRLQHELDTFRPSGEDTVNQRKGPMGMSLFFTKPKMVV